MPGARSARRVAHWSYDALRGVLLPAARSIRARSGRLCGCRFNPARAPRPRAPDRYRPKHAQPYPRAQQLVARVRLARHVSVVRCLGHAANEPCSAGREAWVPRADGRAARTARRTHRRRSPHDVAPPRHTCEARDREHGGICGE
ncbi:uncharacterized protein SCHCODRAFT_02520084 [Schizophyllum commune H4-8]|uniref:Expressed protein n=1 Tax=Schizophyllum commune (strain H4-8 / FGSC 9210) TaxID=578458 RepID=D8QJP3_SCHCM|nr:uncharacterized protein SCHCODRAFT_02519109 [Schizophyllum commune H4-8]XP_050197206.1 uncharacterized protein SCHCODRAFT_02520084 [Schizophyllum commune H4-8]KAI5885489.1 hypothetical protein SCHCODRAFT_02520084 [Schizophyllum commune H4-8]KAI5885829.1 hypothetical protein SCHCODRAFT_02519109 [Schizophyllum commune H4-8]